MANYKNDEIEPRFRKYVKGYDFLSFAKNKYSKKLMDTGNKIADKITSIGKSKEKPKPKEKPEEIYISAEKI